MNPRYVLAFGLVASAGPLWAQDPDLLTLGDQALGSAETTITVLANGTPQALAATGTSLTVFGRAEIEQVQGPDLTRLLERAPGVSVSRNGGPGNFTGVRVRGAEGEQLLVLIDGVRVADVAAPGGGYDFANLALGSLTKIELQRGSNSTIWGSQALGGVLAVTSGSGRGITGSIEGGAHDTVYATAGLALDLDRGQLALNAGHLDSGGFSAAAVGTEADGFRQTDLSGRVQLALAPGITGFLSGRYADARLELDGLAAPDFVLVDTAEYQDTRQQSGAGGLAYSGPALDLRAVLSRAETERANFDPTLGFAPSFTSDGTSERAELRGRWRLAPGVALDFGGEREWLRFSSLFDPLRRTAMTGGYAQLDFDRGPLHFAAGVRRDEHRAFGGETSFGADAALDLGAARLSASYGEGFKAPTLFQLHSDYGNAALQPERSRSFDAAIAFDQGGLRARLTAFHRRTKNLIGFVGCFGTTTGICTDRPFGTYDNVGRARARGLELEGEVTLARGLVAGSAYTLLDAEDRTPGAATRGNGLSRRPRHALNGTLDWRATARAALGADLRVVSRSFDDPANAVPLDGYAVLTLRGEWAASDRVTLFGRIENLWDETYQTAAGYATAGRSAYVGARARF